MSDQVITERAELGELWLAWYFRRSDELLAADLYANASDVQRLRVAQFCNDPGRYAEVKAIHWPCIEEYVAKYEARSEQPVVVENAYVIPEGWVIPNGNHRCCAIYLVEPPGWEVRLTEVQPPPGCLDVLPGLS